LRDQGLSSAEKISEATGIPLFRIRSGLRDMMEAELVEAVGDKYKITAKGTQLI
jgi:predicted transcriptional regulator